MAHNHRQTESQLWFAILGNGFLALIEITYGIWSGSVVMTLEAGHNGLDLIALLLSLYTVRWISRRSQASDHNRLSALVGLANIATLNFWVLYSLLQAIHQLMVPKRVNSGPFFVMGVVSLVLNLLMGVLLHGRHHGLHVKAASLHLLADAGGTIAFFIAGVLVALTGASEWDAIVSMILGLSIVLTTLPLVRECVDELRL